MIIKEIGKVRFSTVYVERWSEYKRFYYAKVEIL
jgi:hypothetical protein